MTFMCLRMVVSAKRISATVACLPSSFTTVVENTQFRLPSERKYLFRIQLALLFRCLLFDHDQIALKIRPSSRLNVALATTGR